VNLQSEQHAQGTRRERPFRSVSFCWQDLAVTMS